MAQNIDLLGAVYSAVPAVLLPKQGGGTASFTDVSDTTAAAADVASGKYFYTAAGTRTQGTASGGGGGASNVVTGTFKGTTTGAAMDVTLSYTGSGYPIAVFIFPKEGTYNSQTGTYYSLVQRYATQAYTAVKIRTTTAPSYSSNGANDHATVQHSYKNSSSNSTSYGNTRNNAAYIFGSSNASAGGSSVVMFKSAKKMSVFIAASSYGFAANIEYTYWVIYSS